MKYKLSVPIMIKTHPEVTAEAWLAELQRAQADRVFLCICRSTDPEDQKRKELESLRALIPFFESAGLEVGVWTFSMGNGLSDEDAALPYACIQDAAGNVCPAICPLDETYGDVFGAWLRDIARAGAKTIMLDDDFRLSYWGSGLCCFCDRHLAAFAELTGQALGREELLQKVFSGGPSAERDAWLKVCGDSLRNLAVRLRADVDAVSPDISLGHCAVLSTWDVDGVDSIELAKIFAGKNRPFLRFIGAPYWAATQHWGCRLGSIIEMERMQRKWCEHEDMEIFSEGDVWPRPRFNVAAALLEGFDTAMRFDGTLDGILKYMIDYECSPHYETGYIDRHVRNRALHQTIEELAAPMPAAGVRVFEVMKKLSQAQLPDAFPGGAYIEQTFIPASSAFLCDNSVPMQYDHPDVTIVFGENARYATPETLQHGAILDAPAAEILMRGGFDVGLRRVLGKAKVQAEHYPDDNETVPGGGTYYNLEADERATYVTRLKGKDAVGGAYHYEDQAGVRFLVYPFHAYESRQSRRTFRCHCRMRQLAASLTYLRRRPMDAVCLGNPDLYLQCKKDEQTLITGLWNFSADDIIQPKITLAETYAEARFINCTGQLHDKEIVLSDLAPYAFAAVALGK